MERMVEQVPGLLAITLKQDSFIIFIDNVFDTINVIYLKENNLLKATFIFSIVHRIDKVNSHIF
jgi:hypothetical protein